MRFYDLCPKIYKLENIKDSTLFNATHFEIHIQNLLFSTFLLLAVLLPLNNQPCTIPTHPRVREKKREINFFNLPKHQPTGVRPFAAFRCLCFDVFCSAPTRPAPYRSRKVFVGRSKFMPAHSSPFSTTQPPALPSPRAGFVAGEPGIIK